MQEKKRDRVTGVLLWTASALIGLLAVGAALMLAGVAGMFYHDAPEYRSALWPCAAYAGVGAVPCLLALGAFCRLIGLIQSDRSFSQESEKTVRFIAVMALIVCAYLVVGFAVSLITGVGAAMLTIVFLFLMPAFLCIGLMALALARLIHRAALLREDNELTV